MEILKFDSVPQKRTRQKKSSTKGLVAAAGFAAIAVLGSTLAANISLNSGTLEFGQGVAVTSACDSDGITASPEAVFANVANGGGFNFASISFTGIADACLGKLFQVNAYGNTSATPLVIATSGANTYDVATFVMSATLGQKSSYITTGSVASAIATNNNKAEIGFMGTQATSGAVYKITLQSSNN
jgi:hypothetical protein